MSAADRTDAAENVPTRTIVLGGKPRKLAFTIGAIRRIKAATGKQKIDLGAELVERIGTYTWCMLLDREYRESVTIEDIEELLSFDMLSDVTDAFVALISGDKKDASDEGKVPRKTAKRTAKPKK